MCCAHDSVEWLVRRRDADNDESDYYTAARAEPHVFVCHMPAAANIPWQCMRNDECECSRTLTTPADRERMYMYVVSVVAPTTYTHASVCIQHTMHLLSITSVTQTYHTPSTTPGCIWVGALRYIYHIHIRTQIDVCNTDVLTETITFMTTTTTTSTMPTMPHPLAPCCLHRAVLGACMQHVCGAKNTFPPGKIHSNVYTRAWQTNSVLADCRLPASSRPPGTMPSVCVCESRSYVGSHRRQSRVHSAQKIYTHIISSRVFRVRARNALYEQ